MSIRDRFLELTFDDTSVTGHGVRGTFLVELAITLGELGDGAATSALGLPLLPGLGSSPARVLRREALLNGRERSSITREHDGTAADTSTAVNVDRTAVLEAQLFQVAFASACVRAVAITAAPLQHEGVGKRGKGASSVVGGDDVLTTTRLTSTSRRPDDHGAALVGLLDVEENLKTAGVGRREILSELGSLVDSAHRVPGLGIGRFPGAVIAATLCTHVSVLPLREGRGNERESNARGNGHL